MLFLKIYVMKLNKMELLPFQADVEMGQIIEVPIAMYHVNTETKETIAFTDCSHLPLDLSSDKQGVFTLYKEGKASPSSLNKGPITSVGKFIHSLPSSLSFSL